MESVEAVIHKSRKSRRRQNALKYEVKVDN